MKILNLYAGIGGNRKGWTLEEGDSVTAVELNPNIAKIYQDTFPEDKVIVGDAHAYLLEHFREFDFIWASPPCPTHSQVRKSLAIKNKNGVMFEQNKPIYPDMTLYQEIILLDNWFDGIYVIENVKPYYEPLIKPQELGRHCFWSNVKLPKENFDARGNFDTGTDLAKILGYDTSNWHNVDKRLLLRNCVEPEVSAYIYIYILQEFNRKPKGYVKQTDLFDFIGE